MSEAQDSDRTKAALKQTLRDLTALHGISGFEQAIVRYTRDRFKPLVDELDIDRYGNITGTKRGKNEHPVLMISAHMDEIGFIVKGIEPTGYLRFDRVGGAGDAVLGCRKVEVNGRFGLVGSISGHLGSAEMLARVAPISDLYIDVGASTAAEVAALGIRIGDPISFIGELAEFTGGDRVCGKGMDDRAGLAILIQAMVELKDETPFGCVQAVATVLEQVGHRGAAMVAYRNKPDYAIAIDGLPAGDTPDFNATDVSVEMGKGAVVLLANSTGAQYTRGSFAHPAMKRLLLQAAAEEHIPIQLAATVNRGSTEAGLIHVSRGGIPTISVGIPRRYSYSPHEMIDLSDAVAAVNLTKSFVKRMQHHQDLSFV